MTETPSARVLVVGAQGGFARGLATALADRGADIALTTALPDAEAAFELRRIARVVTERGRRCLVESIDISIGTGVQVAVRQVAKELGGLDALVVAPALHIDKPAERLTDADWARVVGVNLSGVFYACRAVSRDLFASEDGRIVVVAGGAGAENAVQASLRAGVTALAAGLDAEWSGRGVRVHEVEGATADDEAATAAAVERVMSLLMPAS